jgi:two-component system alkaline phosphatase synthesis response regulator PhoP
MFTIRNELQTVTSGQIMTQPILIVEDEEDIADFLTQVLGEIMPYPILPLSSAGEALEAVRSVRPSLLLLDYRLPDGDGLELSDRLHSSKGLEAVPTVMMTASPPPLKEIRKRHITLLPKPFDIQDLLETLETLLPSQETKAPV